MPSFLCRSHEKSENTYYKLIITYTDSNDFTQQLLNYLYLYANGLNMSPNDKLRISADLRIFKTQEDVLKYCIESSFE